jgi:aldehyde dehydrogenase (NAD+)
MGRLFALLSGKISVSSSQPEESTIVERHRSKHQEATADIEFGAWIDGRLHTQAQKREIIDPVIGRSIVKVPQSDSAAVDTAVEAAWDAFEGEWEAASARARSARL